MLIWLGAVGTVLAVVMTGVLYGIFQLVQKMEENKAILARAASEQLSQYQQWERSSDAWLEKTRTVFSEGGKVIDSHADRILTEYKQATSSFAKSEQELADNLGALLREVKVSKALAQGALAVVEQSVLAVDKLWQMVEMIRTGPRVAARVPKPEDDAEGGANLDQEQAIRDTLANAAARMKEIAVNFQE